MGARGTIQTIQAGRGLAALAVAAHHAGLYANGPDWLLLGQYGVHFFFVLSGFIICHVHAAKDFDPTRYFTARARRVFLPYLPIGLASALWYTAIGQGGWSWLSTLTLLPGEARPALSVAWTLQFEVVFYVIAGLFFYLRAPLVCMGVWAALIVARQTAPVPLSPVETILLNPINLEFCLGMALGLVARRHGFPDVPVGRPLLFLGAASYSIYLAHLPVMAVVWRLGGGFVEMFVLSVAAGCVYHVAVERPLIALRLPRFPTLVWRRTI